MKLSKIRSQFKKASLVKFVIAVVFSAVLSGVAMNAVQAEFYPDRQTFDYNKECNPDDNDPYDRCGSTTGPVFNSFINTPYYGDERQFTDAKRTDQTTGDVYKNVLPDVTDGASEVKIRVYVHNNANSAYNTDGSGVAKNTMVKIALPSGTDSEMRARGYISADNAELVEDTVDFTATKKFRMEYVPGSAMLYNNNAFENGTKLDDSIVTTGAKIGDDALDGDLPGCFEYQATVFITVKIISEEAPSVQFNKLVKNEATSADWGETTTVKPGEKVNWLIELANTGSQDLTNVSIDDILPPHLRVVPGSVRYIDAAQDVPQSDGSLFTTGGIGFGTWKPNGGFYVRFQTEALNDFESCQVTVRNIAHYNTSNNVSGQDHADVVIKKDNCVTTTPTYTCESFTLSKNTVKINEKFTATVKVNAQNGAQFKLATFTFGDEANGQSKFVTNAINNGVVSTDHSYTKEGDYAPRVKLEFTVNGETKTVEDAKCAAQIKVTKDQVLGTTTPTTLPRTGATEVAGIFSVVTIAGAMTHRRMTLKKRS